MSHYFCTKLVAIGKCASIGLLLAALAMSAGCGRSRTYTDSEGQKTTVTQKGQDTEITFKGKDGQEAHFGGGASVPLPDGFPKDVAVYPKSTVFTTAKDKGGTMSVILKTADPAQQVMKFYEEKLKENGWETENTMNLGGTMMLQVSKEGRKLSMTANKDSEQTMVTLVLEKEGK
jgi:hypothetical protein